MLKANICFQSVGFVAKKECIYMFNVVNWTAKRYRLTEMEKVKIKNFEEDPFYAFKTWLFLSKIWDYHEENGEKATNVSFKSVL